MPEIIDFSNRQFYGGALQPLRQFGTDRLPPLVTRYVADGAVEGTGVRRVNRAEAEALVDALVACHEDPAYAGRSMGVITLLGGGQSALVEDLLAQRLSVAERAARRLRVGDAEDFQGDERQIMFIGMVVSRAAIDSDEALRIGGFSAESYQQRLNVAASRAQDQVQVFHSVHPGDLGPTDLRRAYLEYLSSAGGRTRRLPDRRGAAGRAPRPLRQPLRATGVPGAAAARLPGPAAVPRRALPDRLGGRGRRRTAGGRVRRRRVPRRGGRGGRRRDGSGIWSGSDGGSCECGEAGSSATRKRPWSRCGTSWSIWGSSRA